MIQIKGLLCLFVFLFLGGEAYGQTAAQSPAQSGAQNNNRNRIEELFIWKVSDELKLSVSEERVFSTLVREINKKRMDINTDIHNTLKTMENCKLVKTPCEQEISDYRKQVQKYNDMTLEEIDRVKKALGAEKSVRYFVLKNDLTVKLKEMLTPNEKKDSKSSPKIILEQ